MPPSITSGVGAGGGVHFDTVTTDYGNHPLGKLGARQVEVLDGPTSPRSAETGKWAAIRRNVSAFFSRIADVAYSQPEVDARRYNRAQKNLCREFDNMLGYMAGDPPNPAKAVDRMGRMQQHFQDMAKYKPDADLGAVLRARMQVNMGELPPDARLRVDSNLRQLDMDAIEEGMVHDQMRVLSGMADLVGDVPESEVRGNVQMMMGPLRAVREMALVGPRESVRDNIREMSDSDLRAHVQQHNDPEVVSRRERNLRMPEGDRIRAAGEYGRDTAAALNAEMMLRMQGKVNDGLAAIIRNLRDEVPPREKWVKQFQYVMGDASRMQGEMARMGVPGGKDVGLLKQGVAQLSPEDRQVLLGAISSENLADLKSAEVGGHVAPEMQDAITSLDDLITTVLNGRAEAIRDQLHQFTSDIADGRVSPESVGSLKGLRDALRDLEGAGPLPDGVKAEKDRLAEALGNIRPEHLPPERLNNRQVGDMIKVLEHFGVDKSSPALHNALKLEMNNRLEAAMTPYREEYATAMRHAGSGDMTELLRACVRLQTRSEELDAIISSFGTDTVGKDALFEMRYKAQKPVIDAMSKDQLLALHNVLSSPKQAYGLVDMGFTLANKLVLQGKTSEETSEVRSRVSMYMEPLLMSSQLVRERLGELGENNLPLPQQTDNPIRDAQPRQLAALHIALGIDIIGEQRDGTVLARQVPVRT